MACLNFKLSHYRRAGGYAGRILALPPWHGCSPSPREGRAGRGAVRTELLGIGFPLSALLCRGEKEILPAHLWWQYQPASGYACKTMRRPFALILLLPLVAAKL